MHTSTITVVITVTFVNQLCAAQLCFVLCSDLEDRLKIRIEIEHVINSSDHADFKRLGSRVGANRIEWPARTWRATIAYHVRMSTSLHLPCTSITNTFRSFNHRYGRRTRAQARASSVLQLSVVLLPFLRYELKFTNLECQTQKN